MMNVTESAAVLLRRGAVGGARVLAHRDGDGYATPTYSVRDSQTQRVLVHAHDIAQAIDWMSQFEAMCAYEFGILRQVYTDTPQVCPTDDDLAHESFRRSERILTELGFFP